MHTSWRCGVNGVHDECTMATTRFGTRYDMCVFAHAAGGFCKGTCLADTMRAGRCRVRHLKFDAPLQPLFGQVGARELEHFHLQRVADEPPLRTHTCQSVAG